MRRSSIYRWKSRTAWYIFLFLPFPTTLKRNFRLLILMQELWFLLWSHWRHSNSFTLFLFDVMSQHIRDNLPVFLILVGNSVALPKERGSLARRPLAGRLRFAPVWSWVVLMWFSIGFRNRYLKTRCIWMSEFADHLVTLLFWLFRSRRNSHNETLKCFAFNRLKRNWLDSSPEKNSLSRRRRQLWTWRRSRENHFLWGPDEIFC